RNTDISQGRFINALDVERRQKVALIGAYLVNELFGTVNPIGEKIRINGDLYTVIGVLEMKSNASAQSSDDRVIIPYSTATRLLKNANIRNFYIQGKTPETVAQAMAALEGFLFKTFNDETAYRVFN